MPFRSRAFLTASAVRSVWLATCLSASTPSMRWMPPCRSRPRLRACLSGYRYQRETATTRRTNAIRTRRCLGILLAALPRHDAADGGAVEFELHLIGHPQGDGVLAQPRDGSMHPAGGHHAVASLHRRQHSLAILLLLLLRTEQEEVEDGEHRHHDDDGGKHALRAAPGRARCLVCEVRKAH